MFPSFSAELRLLESDFSIGMEGWTLGDFFNATHGALPQYISAGGIDGGGYIQGTDIYGFNSFHAPDSWLGNQSQLCGGVLHLHQLARSNDALNYPLVVLGSGATRLQFRTAPPGTDWTEYVIPFRAEAGWEMGNGSGDPGPAATEADLQAVLANLQWFALDADWQTGDDLVGLDQVYVSMPEPSAWLLSGSGLAGLVVGATRRRRRSSL